MLSPYNDMLLKWRDGRENKGRDRDEIEEIHQSARKGRDLLGPHDDSNYNYKKNHSNSTSNSTKRKLSSPSSDASNIVSSNRKRRSSTGKPTEGKLEGQKGEKTNPVEDFRKTSVSEKKRTGVSRAYSESRKKTIQTSAKSTIPTVTSSNTIEPAYDDTHKSKDRRTSMSVTEKEIALVHVNWFTKQSQISFQRKMAIIRKPQSTSKKLVQEGDSGGPNFLGTSQYCAWLIIGYYGKNKIYVQVRITFWYGIHVLKASGRSRGRCTEEIDNIKTLIMANEIQYVFVRLSVGIHGNSASTGYRDLFLVCLGPSVSGEERLSKGQHVYEISQLFKVNTRSKKIIIIFKPYDSQLTVLSTKNFSEHMLRELSHPNSRSHVLD